MVGISLLQPLIEALSAGDRARVIAKLSVLVASPDRDRVGVRAVSMGDAPAHRTVAVDRHRCGCVGVLFRDLCWRLRAAVFSIDELQPRVRGRGRCDARRLRQGLTSFALWALAFVFRSPPRMPGCVHSNPKSFDSKPSSRRSLPSGAALSAQHAQRDRRPGHR